MNFNQNCLKSRFWSTQSATGATRATAATGATGATRATRATRATGATGATDATGATCAKHTEGGPLNLHQNCLKSRLWPTLIQSLKISGPANEI